MKKVFYFLILVVVTANQSIGQVCSGTLGENIFTDGDFGSGAANIIPVDPQIAPGYIYAPTPPPNDGYYNITNDIGQWSSTFGWMEIGDNSPDPNGYMMVVNGSYDPGLFYEQEVSGLCENTLYQFSADVFNLIRAGNNLIKPNISFLINGVIVYNSGDVPENEQWNTYGFTFTTLPNQTSVTLSLANNAPGGNGNDIALDNIAFRPCGPTAFISPNLVSNICEDGTPLDLQASIIGNQYPTPNIQWQQSFDLGQTWIDIPGANNLIFTHSNLTAGFYYYRYLLSNDPLNLQNSRCRVVSNVKIVQVVPKFYTLSDSLCEGASYTVGSSVYTESGIYTDTLLSSIGCDSIVTLNLTITQNVIGAILEVQDPSCSYLDDGSIEVDMITGGNPPFTYLIDGTPISGGSIASDLAAGSYTYSIVDGGGCILNIPTSLESPIPFTVELYPDSEVNLGDSSQAISSGNYPIAYYAWNPPHWVDCEVNCSPVEFLPTQTGYLTLIATSEEGCIASDSVYVKVNEVRKVFIPSAFTPNADGLNDFFTVMGDFPSAYQVDQLLILDRWGGVVFENTNFPLNDPGQGWDGTLRGTPAPEGVYPYVARVRFLDEVVSTYSGTITLYR